MMVKMTVKKFGGSLGLVLPKEAVTAINVQEGDSLFMSKSPDGSFRITASDPEFERQMEAARNGMRKYRNTLRELAK